MMFVRNMDFGERLSWLEEEYEDLIGKKNEPVYVNGVYERYVNPVLTAAHAPLFWRYDLDKETNPYLEERFGIHAVFNSGAIKWNGKYVLVARVEGADRKSFFAVAESEDGTEGFRFWDRPIVMPEYGEPATNVYDMRLTAHEDGWIYGVFCVERKDPDAPAGDLSSAVAAAGIARTRDLVDWERLPDLKSSTQQRNVVLHPEFIDGKYAFYTRPQDGFIDAGSGGGIGWSLVPDITKAEVSEERIINFRHYHTVKELIKLRVGQRTDLIGTPTTVGLKAYVAKTLEILLPSRFHIVSERMLQSIGISYRIAVFAIAAETCDLTGVGSRNAHGVVEFPVVHVIGTISQVN